MSAPLIGQRYRGVEGHSAYLLRQATYEFRGAMELALAEAAIEDGFTPGEIAAIKTWLVRAAQRMEHVSAAQRA